MRPSTVKRWLVTPVTIVRAGNLNQYGEPANEPPVNTLARVVHSLKRSVTVSGEEFTSTTQVVMLELVSVGDKIAINGTPRVVRAVTSAHSLSGRGVTLIEAHL